MFRADRFIFLALCASLLLHAGMLTVAAEKARYPKIYLPPLRKPGSTVVIALQPPPPPPPMDDMGERTGVGTASSSSQGPTPLQARQADQDQPQLSRDPTGPAKMGHEPSPSNTPPGERGRGGQRGQIAIETPAPQVTPPQPAPKPAIQAPKVAAVTPPKAPAEPPKTVAQQPTPEQRELASRIVKELTAKARALLVPAEAGTPAPDAAPAVQVASATPAPPSPPKKAVEVAPQQTTGDGLAPGRASVADPFQQSDSESDAFTTVGSAVVHNGRINVRSGRKIKTVRPLLLVPGILDTIGVSDPTVQLKVNIDATGKVTFVDILHSSGSNDIDQPCVVAMYDWWFEPSRDAKGRPIPDVVLFTLSFR